MIPSLGLGRVPQNGTYLSLGQERLKRAAFWEDRQIVFVASGGGAPSLGQLPLDPAGATVGFCLSNRFNLL